MKRHALFVGVNDYADGAFKNLRYSLSDAVALSGAFAARGFDVEVLSNPKAETVLGAVERKASGLGPGDVFLFFFAGHGFTAPDGSHLLICSNDRLAYLRHNRAGIPVDLLEEITNGRGCNRAFLLDACRTDVLAGVENRGAETRDLALVSLPDAKVHAGTCCVLRSCDRFCPAMEFDDLGHGVFTRAVMDVLGDDSFCATPFGEAFVAGIRSRMHVILSAHSAVGTQNPCFQTNGEAFFLFEGVAPMPSASQPPISYHQPIATPPALVLCPVCGKKNHPEDTFKCRECGKDNLCLRHQDEDTFLCADCAALKRRERAEREAAERRAREEEVRKAREAALRNGTCLETGICRTLTLPGGAEMEMIYCPPGEFMMGSPTTEEGRSDTETQHRVRLTKGFWLGKYPVTQKQWKSVMGNNPSGFKGDDLPVETVSWDDCKDFIDKVKSSAKQQLGGEARFPTEAEWEYACRAGTTTAYCWGNALNGDKANCDGNYPCGTKTKGPYLEKTTPVGRYTPNPWGFYDMHGNVWEWCNDRYGDYPSGSVTNPTGPAAGDYRVLRGGSWRDYARRCRSAYRNWLDPGRRFNFCGFRLCCWGDQCLSHRSTDYRSEACADRETVERLFQDKYNFLKSGPYKEIGKPTQDGLQKNPDGGWRCTYGATWDIFRHDVWAAITIRPGDDKVHETHGAICHRWWHQEGGPSGSLGYPISDEEVYGLPKSEDRISHFERGDIIFRKAKENTTDATFVIKKVQLWAGGPYWADRNIGAEHPWKAGYYFWWGDTVGYKFEDGVWVASDGSSKGYSFDVNNVPTFGESISSLRATRWITADDTLAPEHDAAQVQWGGGWRMPTQQELLDLCNKCDWTWKDTNGVGGYVIRGRGAYVSASIFLPCAGYGKGTLLDTVGSDGSYWSSVPSSGNYDLAEGLFFLSGYNATDSSRRNYGRSVRPVQGGAK